MEDLSIGDIVILKSDDGEYPFIKMTVSKINSDEVECIWRDGTNFSKMKFTKGTLKKIG